MVEAFLRPESAGSRVAAVITASIFVLIGLVLAFVVPICGVPILIIAVMILIIVPFIKDLVGACPKCGKEVRISRSRTGFRYPDAITCKACMTRLIFDQKTQMLRDI